MLWNVAEAILSSAVISPCCETLALKCVHDGTNPDECIVAIETYAPNNHYLLPCKVHGHCTQHTH